jgi:hypothetical protein
LVLADQRRGELVMKLAPSLTRRLIGEFARTPPGTGTAQAADAAAQARAEGADGDSHPGPTCSKLLRMLTDRELEILTMVPRGLEAAPPG